MKLTPEERNRLSLGAPVTKLLDVDQSRISGTPSRWAGSSSGIMTSPFFLQPTSASGVRRVTFNTSVSF